MSETNQIATATNFIREIVVDDLASGKTRRVHTRFPPEPNGFLHIGHAKAICLNLGLAREFAGVCNLRMDDTNPEKEEVSYVEAICKDVHWLAAGWADRHLGVASPGELPEKQVEGGKLDYVMPPAQVGVTEAAAVTPFHTSAYFEALHEFAVRLIELGRAYVCDLSAEETEAFRGSPDQPGRDSPFRERTPSENLELFERMKAGEFPDGARTLKAKIDMSSPNIWMRDPVLYRIRHVQHHQTGNDWCIYPLYDFAHCLSDYIEGISHSLCTLEFEVHRPLYDWILEALELPRTLPRQFEFSRLNLTYTVMSKRKLLKLVEGGHVAGWDDPRMPTISGIRRRGVPAEVVRDFVVGTGITKFKGVTDLAVFEHAQRAALNSLAERRLAVLDPLKVVITNLPDDHSEELDAVNNPEDEAAGKRKIPFTRELYVEATDFMEEPPKKFFRLKPGGEVRLKYAYIIKCDEVIKDQAGNVIELRCSADLESRSGLPGAGRKVKGTIHWVSAVHCVEAELRLYDRLFAAEQPEAGDDYLNNINPESLQVVIAKCEPSLGEYRPESRYQLERTCYIAPDPDWGEQLPVYNRIVTLRDSWAKQVGK